MSIKHTSSARLVERIAALEAAMALREQEQVYTHKHHPERNLYQNSELNVRVTAPDARLNTIFAICSALLVTHEQLAALQIVVRESMQLFPGALGAAVFLFDPSNRQLGLYATNAGQPANIEVQPGQGLAGRAFLVPRAMLMAGPEIEMALDEPNAESSVQMRQLFIHWPPSSALLTPLRLADERLGALVMYGGTQAHLFHPRDIPCIQGLADLAAVAIVEYRQSKRVEKFEYDLAQTRARHAETESQLDFAQAQLIQSAKLAAVGELAASVAHEINNPLYAARNSLYLIAQEMDTRSPQRAFLDIAQQELGRIARIITRMRDFYRPVRTDLTPTDINNVLRETLDLVQTHLLHSQIRIETELNADLPLVTAHTDQLRQVFLNLMLNACDAMPNGGGLRISTMIRPSTNTQAPQIVIDISDTGTGIPPEHLPRIFEPFYTTKPHGTGLGLAISMHIVTQHGGMITPRSNSTGGTTFSITLPLDAPPMR